MSPAPFETHGMNPMNVLRDGTVHGRGSQAGFWWSGASRPSLDPTKTASSGLSEPVEAAVDEAVALIEKLVVKVLDGAPVDEVLQSHKRRGYVNGSDER